MIRGLCRAAAECWPAMSPASPRWSVLGVLIGRGSVSAGALNQKVDPVLVAVPVLAAIALAAVVIRLVPLALRAASSTSPRRWPLTKLTLAEATAQPLRSVATASLIAVTVMFAFLTFGYASTLRLGSRDQAAFAVPYDFRVQLGASLVRPQALMTAESVGCAGSGDDDDRRVASWRCVRRSATTVQTVELLGLDPATLQHLHGWRSSFGPDPTALAKLIDEPAPGTFGTPIAADAVSLEFDGTGFDGLHIAAVIARVDGTWHELTLDEEFDGGVRTTLTPGDAGGELVGFRLAQPAEDVRTDRASHRRRQHLAVGPADRRGRATRADHRADGRATTICAAGRSAARRRCNGRGRRPTRR